MGRANLTWTLDVVRLLCAFGAVHAPIARDGVVLAIGVAQIVAVLPLVPRGLGLVEGLSGGDAVTSRRRTRPKRG